MKFWQLMSISREEDGLVAQIASTRASWEKYLRFADARKDSIDSQDRTILDCEVDVEFVNKVLERTTRQLYLSTDGWLRSYPREESDSALSLLEAFRRFGADAVEDALEFGSFAAAAPQSGSSASVQN